jgi:hypothetical protein
LTSTPLRWSHPIVVNGLSHVSLGAADQERVVECSAGNDRTAWAVRLGRTFVSHLDSNIHLMVAAAIVSGSERACTYDTLIRLGHLLTSTEITFRNKHSGNSGTFPLETCGHGCRLASTQRSSSNIPPRTLDRVGSVPTQRWERLCVSGIAPTIRHNYRLGARAQRPARNVQI